MEERGKGARRADGTRGDPPVLPAGLSRVNLNAAGIDVGAESHFVAVPEDRCDTRVREFEAFTGELYRLADWLAECGIETVALESTGVYWIPLFGVLEERGFEVLLVDPRGIKNAPGRKTDVLDSQWIQQLHTYGLLSGAFRPDEDIRSLRSYMRQRAMLVEGAARHVQHMQKALTQMNVKLQHVISDITGTTGLAIVDAIVGGERDPLKLAQLRDPRIRADTSTIARSLEGHWREEHIFELAQARELYRVYQGKIAECDRKLEALLEEWDDSGDPRPPLDKPGRSKRAKNAPAFDVRSHLYRMTGVDLTRIDGVDAHTALKVISEVGVDMSRWETPKHFASWLGLSPNNRVTGGKVISSRTKPSANRAAAALRLAAFGLHRSGQRPGGVPAEEEGAAGASQGHHCDGSQAGEDHLLDAEVWTRVHGRRSRVLRGAAPRESPPQRETQGQEARLPAGAARRPRSGWNRSSRTPDRRFGDGVVSR